MGWFKGRRPTDDPGAPDFYLAALDRMEAVVDRWEELMTLRGGTTVRIEPDVVGAETARVGERASLVLRGVVTGRDDDGAFTFQLDDWEDGDALTEMVQDAALWGGE